MKRKTEVNVVNLGSRLLTLKTFLDECVPREAVDRPERQYNALMTNGTCSSDTIELDVDGFEGAMFEHKLIRLLSGDKISVMTANLYAQAHIRHMFNAESEELFNNMVVEHSMEYGDGTVLVRLAPRTWLVADSRDYRRYEYTTSRTALTEPRELVGLACLAPVRAMIFKVDRLTLKESQARMDEHIRNNPDTLRLSSEINKQENEKFMRALDKIEKDKK